METTLLYLVLSGLLTILLWVPYILGRLFLWGLPAFLSNYPDKEFPAKQPDPPIWMQRAQRAHLNMVETMPAFVAVVVAALFLQQGVEGAEAAVALWAQIFFFARLAHAVVYILGLPYLRTPTYLVSVAAIVMIAVTILM